IIAFAGIPETVILFFIPVKLLSGIAIFTTPELKVGLKLDTASFTDVRGWIVPSQNSALAGIIFTGSGSRLRVIFLVSETDAQLSFPVAVKVSVTVPADRSFGPGVYLLFVIEVALLNVPSPDVVHNV